MATTTFTNGVTLSDAGWFNDVDAVTYDGATTQVLVGGGAGVLAVWTTATGTGAPVRAVAPTFTSGITVSAGLASLAGGCAVSGQVLSSALDVGIAATKKVYFDGIGANGNTYIVEASADSLQIFAGGTRAASFINGGVALNGGSEVEGNWQPGTDNTYACGGAAKRWTVIYAINGTINTSDERQKIKLDTPMPGLAFVDAVHPFFGKWVVGGNTVTEEPDGFEEDGETPKFRKIVTPRPGVRTHAFFSAQEVKGQMDRLGLDWGAYVYVPEIDEHGLRPDQMIPPLWVAVQELSAWKAKAEVALAAKGIMI